VLFGSTSLAARIERAEARLVADGAEATAGRHPDRPVLVQPLAGGVACYAGSHSPLNKVAGLGFAGPLDERELATVEAALAERGCAVQVELSNLAAPEIGVALTARGYVLRGFENVLGRPLPAEAIPTSRSVRVDESGPDELPLWLEVVVTGFATPDDQGVPSHESFPREALEETHGDLAAAPGFVRYLARREGVPAGGASLRLFEGIAQLCGAATLPEHRRRGVQGALLAERLRVAANAGCDVAVVTTQPASKSQENAQRHGFELLYTRAVLVREP